MKRFLKYAMFAAVGAMGIGLTSCGGDDGPGTDDPGSLWSGEASTPKYIADAAVYDVTSTSRISSVELTESGDYLIIPANYTGYAPARAGKEKSARSLFRTGKKNRDTRSGISTSGITYGTFTKNSDGSFNLKGIGKMTYSNGNLTITSDSGSELVNASARKVAPKYDSNELNIRLCRSWYVKNAYTKVYDSNDRLIATVKYSSSDLKDEFVKYVIVTRAGSFVQVDWDEEVGDLGYWSWNNVKNQIFRYTWADDSDDGGFIQCYFNDNNATFVEEYTDYDSDYGDGELRFVEHVGCTSK